MENCGDGVKGVDGPGEQIEVSGDGVGFPSTTDLTPSARPWDF
jgi:hypothetical protein